MAKHALLFGIQDYPHLEGQDLAGPRNDIIEIGTLLLDRYAFPDDHVSAYFDGAIDRETVLKGFQELEERVEKDDIVVVCYSGHGSRSIRGGQRVESLVPSDSGRPAPHGDGGENRDIYDLEVNDWIRKLNAKTPNLTLIFDCCHSGSVTRNPFVDAVREVPEDERDTSQALSNDALVERAARLAESSARLLQDRRRALVLAACRAEEKAKEYRVSVDGDTYTHGVFSYFLSCALKDPGPGMTWRGLFESIAPRISALFPSQHPQIEGPWDQILFGTDEYRPRSYLRVKEIIRNSDPAAGADAAEAEDAATDRQARLVLSGGAAQGVSVGSRWTLCSATTQDPESAPEIAELVVESVAAGSSMARAVGNHTELREGQRAFLRQMVIPKPLLRVALQIQDHADLNESRLRRRLSSSPLIEITEADDPGDADVLVHGLAPRSQVGDDDPCPTLGPLDKATWAAVAKDGSAPIRAKAAERGAISSWVRSLEQVARYRGLLSIEHPRVGHPRVGHAWSEKVEMRLQRYQDGGFVDVETAPGDGLPTFHWGEGLEAVISNHHDVEVWVSLLNFSCDFSIGLLLPHELDPHRPSEGYRLRPGQELRLVQDYFAAFLQMDRGLTLSRPERFPWAMATEGDKPEGLEHLRLMVTDAPASFEMLSQTNTRSDPGETGHPLRELCRLYAYGGGTRSVDVRSPTGSEPQWCVVSRSLIVTDPQLEPSS